MTRMPYALVDKPSADDAEIRILDQILVLLEDLRGDRSWAELSREIGVSRPMLRMMELNGTPPGIDTLSMLVDWDEETFLPLVLNYIKHRGKLLRSSLF